MGNGGKEEYTSLSKHIKRQPNISVVVRTTLEGIIFQILVCKLWVGKSQSEW